MYKVIDLARLAEVTPDAVRHYVHIGLLTPSRDPDNNYKLFKEEDVKTLQFVKQAQSLGFTLAEITQILERSCHGESPCPDVREMIQRRILENKKKLEDLNALQTRMETALERWEKMPDGVPDGESICHLIESMILDDGS